jgi:hypothetical protein
MSQGVSMLIVHRTFLASENTDGNQKLETAGQK